MLIRPTTFQAASLPTRRAVAADPQPTPTPAPPPPPDIDFSKIDTAEKAALTPAVNTATVLAAIATFAFSFNSHAPLATSLQLAMGDHTTGSINYSLVQDPKTNSIGLKAAGTLGDQPFDETWAIDDQAPAIHINGSIGSNPETLTIVPVQGQEAVSVDGKIGDVEVHQTITVNKDAPAGVPTAVIDGTLAGVAHHQELNYTQTNNQLQVQINGTLGDKSSVSTLNGQGPSDPSAATFSLTSSGTVAGIPFNMSGGFGPSARQ